MYLYRWNISTSTYNTNTMMWLVWSQLRYLHFLNMYITCISNTSTFILRAPIHLPGTRSRSTDKYNDNYTCIHWTKSVYNIQNEIKLKWYTKNADQTYYFFQTLESIYLTLEVFSYLPSRGHNFFFFCVPLCVIATFTLF